MSDPTAQEKAAAKVFEAISEASPATIDDIAKLADAYSKAAYGGQGGAMEYTYTAHEGDKRERQTGFVSDSAA